MLNFLYPTKDQMISYLGTVSKWIGAGLVSRGVAISPDTAAIFTGPEALQFYAGILMAGLPLIRDRFIHSNAGKLEAAAQLASGPSPAIRPIEVMPSAAPEIQKMAMDPAVPTVVVAPPPPFVHSNLSQRR
jgi:hypothetical protein